MNFKETPCDEQRLQVLQALRAVAALAVVLWHGSRFISPYDDYEGLGWRLFGAGGSMGVDLFFVISGFIMVYTTRNNRDVLEFAVKRFCRIYPVYIIATLAFVLIHPHGYASWADSEKLARLAVSFTFVPTYYDQLLAIQLPILGVGWTLNYEIYFYAVFGLSLLFGRYRWIAFSVWITLTLFIIPLIFGISAPSMSPIVDYGFSTAYVVLVTNPIIWLFVAGVVIGLVYSSSFHLNRFGAILLILFASTLQIYQYFGHFSSNHGLTQGGASAITIVFVLAMASKSLTLRVPKALVALGDMSYSLYLWHPFVQLGLEKGFVYSGQGVYATGFPFLFLTTAFSIMLAMISHRLIEQALSGKFRNFIFTKMKMLKSNIA